MKEFIDYPYSWRQWRSWYTDSDSWTLDHFERATATQYAWYRLKLFFLRLLPRPEVLWSLVVIAAVAWGCWKLVFDPHNSLNFIMRFLPHVKG